MSRKPKQPAADVPEPAAGLSENEKSALAVLLAAGWIALADARLEDARDPETGRWTWTHEGRHSLALYKDTAP